MTAELFVLVPLPILATIDKGGTSGEISAQMSEPEQLAKIIAVSSGSGESLIQVDGINRSHFMSATDARRVGRWFKVDAAVQAGWMHARRRAAGITLKGFAQLLNARVRNPGAHTYIVLTYAPNLPDEYALAGVPSLAAWAVSSTGVLPVDVDVDAAVSGMYQLKEHWPIDALQGRRVCIVGAGSIGSASAHALAMAGIGTLDLVDPDRLLRHNLIRHTCSARQVGKFKVSALREDLRLQRPDTHVNAFPLDAVEDANAMRELFETVDLVVCATDGVSSRRVVGHLARRAKKDAILACVLEGGTLGEIIRLRPWADRGCITCTRTHLQQLGAFDPEPGINRPYGEGTHHRPMTAVGADLQLVGAHAAKMTTATLLQAEGFNDQRLLSDHMIIALRPDPMWPKPYDVRRCGETKWIHAAPPQPGCPTCQTDQPAPSDVVEKETSIDAR